MQIIATLRLSRSWKRERSGGCKASAAAGGWVLPHPITVTLQRQYTLTLLEDALSRAGQVENASIPGAQVSPSPVASQRAHSGPSSRTARASYSATSAGVRVSAQRPFTP
jgi:hypothetical protein